MKAYYWVPEDFLFESAGDCLDARPDDGAAALVISETHWREVENENDRLKSQNKIMRSALEEIKDEVWSSNPIHHRIRDILKRCGDSIKTATEGEK